MTLIAIDTSFLAHRAMHSTGNLTANDVRSGVVFGILSCALQLALRHRSHHLVFCFDSHNHESVRAIQFPEYRKARRMADKTPEEVQALVEMHWQLKLLGTEILPAIGWPCLKVNGFEADDLLAAVSACPEWRLWDHPEPSTIDRKSKGVKGHALALSATPDTPQALFQAGLAPLPGRCVLVTRDHDLLQCLCSGQIAMDDMSGKLWTEERFRQEYDGLTPAQWALVKAIGGCTSDGIPGCAPGIGEGRAIAYLQNKLDVEGRWFRLICQNVESVNKTHANLRLVRLPHPDFPGLVGPEPLRFDKHAFMDVCKQYNLASFTTPEKLAQWRKVFRGEWEA